MKQYYIAFFSAFIFSFFLTPFAKKLAHKLKVYDIPKDDRKLHKEPIPYLGGAAIYISTVVSMLIFLPIDRLNISIIIGGTIIFLAGLTDDIKDISPRVKLLTQIIAAGLVYWSGVRIEFITNPFPDSEFLFLFNLTLPITILWIVGITNTINLIDGIDGLASGVTAIASTAMMFIAAINGYNFIMIECAIVSGASLGFLPYNFNPAKIFMGDTGALFLGYMLAVLSILGVMKITTIVTLAVMIFILGIPIIDTAYAIMRRIINKKPIMVADKGHVHHRLLDIGFSQKETVVILYVVSIIFGVAAIFVSDSKPIIGSIIIAGVSVFVLIAGKKLGLLNGSEK